MASKRMNWGGARPGAGRKAGPQEQVRRNRVTVLLTDAEFALLHRVAKQKNAPVGTAAHEIISRSLARRRK